jgi:hypothetical protein
MESSNLDKIKSKTANELSVLQGAGTSRKNLMEHFAENKRVERGSKPQWRMSLQPCRHREEACKVGRTNSMAVSEAMVWIRSSLRLPQSLPPFKRSS